MLAEWGVLTVLLLLRQTLLSDLDVSLPGLESLYPALSVIDRGSRGPNIEELDEFLKFLQEFLLLAIGVGKRFFVASLELVPVKGCQMSRCARRSLGGVFVAV
jgi:hypothetical protein